MGLTHDIDVMVDVANELKDEEQIHFLFIGEGGKKKLVEKKMQDYGLHNCTMLPYQDTEVLPYSMGAADIGIVTTATEQTGLSIPSKVNAYMSVGAILLCLAEPKSELGRLVNENQVGKCFGKSEVPAMASYIRELFHDPQLSHRMKQRSRQMSYSFTPENAKQFLVEK